MAMTIYTHEICLQHEMGPNHPESPARLSVIMQILKKAPWAENLYWRESPLATQAQLMRVHHPRYVEQIFACAPKQGYVQLDPDTCMNPFTLSAALRAAGAMVAAVDDVFTSTNQKIFCLSRPPGHHAMPDAAMGFCFFNNIAVGVAHALAQYHCQRLAIIDFDVHHGNGTESMFAHEPKVCFWSSFQHPFYPGAHLDHQPPSIHLCPLPAGAGSLEIRDKIDNHVIPLLEKFQPECIFVSAGFDAHQLDPLANLQFTTQDYAYIAKKLKIIADKYSQGRMIATLEGGYHLQALPQSVYAFIEALL